MVNATLDEWVAALSAELGVDLEVDVRLLLEVARDAAHAVDRPAAPLTTFLVGYAAGIAAARGEEAGGAIDGTGLAHLPSAETAHSTDPAATPTEVDPAQAVAGAARVATDLAARWPGNPESRGGDGSRDPLGAAS
jgi:hypothetical protein